MARHSNVTRDGDLPPGHGFLLHGLPVGERTCPHACSVGERVDIYHSCIKTSGKFADHSLSNLTTVYTNLTAKLSFLHPRCTAVGYSEKPQVIFRFREGPPVDLSPFRYLVAGKSIQNSTLYAEKVIWVITMGV